MQDNVHVVHDDKNIKGFRDKYSFLSNFHKSPVYFEGVLYPTSENAYQAAKTLDVPTRLTLFVNTPPAMAKKNGKVVVERPDWHRVKYDVMSAVVFDKFYRDIDLRHSLLSTGTKYLEETNVWHDTYWGVCNGKGENNLGKILMGIRQFWGSKYTELLGYEKPNLNPLF